MSDDDFQPLNYREFPDATVERILRAIQPGNTAFVTQSDLLSELDRRRMQAVNDEWRDSPETCATAHIRNLTWAVLGISVVAATAALITLVVSLSSTG